MATRPNITLPNGQVISGSDPSYAEYASQMSGTIASTTPNQITPAPTTPAPISSPTIPTPAPTTTPTPEPVKTGFTADQIKGLDSAFQRQKEGKATADDEKNLAYATSKGWKPSVVVPGTLPQKDFAEALDPQKSAEISQTANNLTQFSDKQIQELNRAYQKTLDGTATDTDIKNLEYAKSKGYDPTAMTDQTGTPKEEIKEITTADRIYDLLSNMGELRSEAKKQAMKEQDLEGKSQELAEAQSFANLLRTKIQNEGILDIKEQDVVRSKPILTSQISGQLNELSREQKLDAMILQNNYNNALVEVQIAQGNYDRAREIVKEISQDYYDNLGFQLDALYFKQEIEDKEYERMRQDLEYERGLAMEGYVHIKGASGLEGLTEEEIFRDPLTGKIYLKPEPDVSQIININGRMKGIDSKGNIIRDFGSSSQGLSISEQINLLNAGLTLDENGQVVRDISGANVDQIANAIKQIESNNNYEAKGASGEYGAYQFMPATWAEWSKEYAKAKGISLMPGGMSMSPENQDAVAKFKIQQWLSQGLSPQQIAAKWNSGSEVGWENKIGVNKQGVAYNVPAYVKRFTDALGTQVGGGQVDAFTILNATNLIRDVVGPRGVTNTELVNSVASLLAQGMTKDDVSDMIRYSSQSLDYGEWRSIANSVFSNVPAAKRQTIENGLDDFIQNGDMFGAKDYILKVARDTALAEEKKNVTAREEALYAIGIIEDSLNQYISMGGNTGLLTGNVEKFYQNVLKKTKDPIKAELANTISQTIQTYRQQLTGAAFTESEAREYNRLFPSITKSPELNQALINSLKSQYERNMRLFYERQLGKSGYNKLEELTGEKIIGVGELDRFNNSSDTSNSDLIKNYLINNGF